MSESKSIDSEQQFIKGNINITVEKVRVDGNGVIILTGPSGCGKGEIAKALCCFLSIPKERHISMGDALRKTVDKAKEDEGFRSSLSDKYHISDRISIFDPMENKPEIIRKAENHKNEVISSLKITGGMISQMDWLEFCVTNGLLIPDEWTVKIIDALFESFTKLNSEIIILDGYPRTVTAAENLLATFNRLNVPVIKVLHLFITKEQMKVRALNRKRIDDTQDSLERRYQFYIEKVQPCIDYLKNCLGTSMVALIDAYQPVFDKDRQIKIDASIFEVVLSVMEALGLPRFLTDLR